ncbi:MAG: hypothetical protein V3U28_07815 [Candidatus Acidoferrales bacterium]
MLEPCSFLFVTLDSCRYDTFAAANIPNLKSLGTLHRATAPSHFTYGSHAAMFVGFTPGIPDARENYLNPKYGKIFKLDDIGFPSSGSDFVTLPGRNIIQGFNRLGYVTLGTGAVGWLDPRIRAGRTLTRDFHHYFYAGNTYSLPRQLEWSQRHLARFDGRRVFLFLNVGETHTPYYYQGAPWSPQENPCIPFSDKNEATECRRRQTACLEFVDAQLGPLLRQFQHANILVCADHGDAWGEDGLWEHGIHHPIVMEVPLLFRLPNPPPPWKRPLWRRLGSPFKRALYRGLYQPPPE